MKCRVYSSNRKHNQYVIASAEKGVSNLPRQAQDEIGIKTDLTKAPIRSGIRTYLVRSN